MGSATGGAAGVGGALAYFLVGNMLLEEQLVVLLPELLDVERALFTVKIIKF